MKTILFTQQNYKKNDVIFDLLYFCLRKLKIMKNPVNLTLNFLMKLIKLEGIANITKTCNLCNNIACYISKGESLCKKHMKCENLVVNESNIFSQNEINEIITLSNSRVLKEIDSIEASHLFINKIYKIFNDCF